MAALDFSALAGPVSEAEPCGPDMEGDGDFMNVMARLEVALPSSYFRRDDEGRQVGFDRTSIDFATAFADLQPLLAQTRDLRLLVIATKLSILNRDLPGFAGGLSAIAEVVSGHWETVHPRADEDGDFILREVALQSLDDMPTMVFPLQHAPLIVSRRLGPLAFRSQLVASGETRLVEGEEHPDTGSIQAALTDIELPALIASRDHMVASREALARISAAWAEHAGGQLDFPRLSTLIGQIVAFLDGAIGRRADAPAGSAAAPTADQAQVSTTTLAAGECATVQDASNYLAGCMAYFRKSEPSSPAVLLIGQAQQLAGKSLLEVIQILFPAQIERAMVSVGGEVPFQLPLERLSGGETQNDWESTEDASEESYPEETDGEQPGEESSDGEPESAGGETAPSTRHPAGAGAPVPVVTRADAIGKMRAVAAFYRRVEPSHPTPLLMDKACALAQHDFLALLSDILPEVRIRPEPGN